MLLLATGQAAMALEEPEYDILANAENYELRRYSPYLVAEVDVQSKSADSQGFRTLAAYIFGDNSDGEKMKMTAPVESRAAAAEGEVTYGFVMESKYARDTLPVPADERIRIREKPGRVVAALRFSGRWSKANITKHEEKLLRDLSADGIETIGGVELARYNSPFTPWFLRRNEIIVPVRWPIEGR